MDGLRLAVSWLSVLPVPAGEVNDRSSKQAIALAPLVGALLGAAGALLLWGLSFTGAPPLLAGLLVVALLALLTRGMHVDGLADTVDGLGCYGGPERALQVMRDGGTGPFAVVALIIAVGAQAVSIGALVQQPWVLVLACAVGRAGFVLCCRSGVPAARPEGLGALVAGTQPSWLVAAWWLVLMLAAFSLAGPQAFLGVLIAAALLNLFTRHVTHRFGGINGDVLGAASEIGTTLVLIAAALGPS